MARCLVIGDGSNMNVQCLGHVIVRQIFILWLVSVGYKGRVVMSDTVTDCHCLPLSLVDTVVNLIMPHFHLDPADPNFDLDLSHFGTHFVISSALNDYNTSHREDDVIWILQILNPTVGHVVHVCVFIG